MSGRIADSVPHRSFITPIFCQGVDRQFRYTTTISKLRLPTVPMVNNGFFTTKITFTIRQTNLVSECKLEDIDRVSNRR